jgi:K+-transporting ATPase ATPase A chain
MFSPPRFGNDVVFKWIDHGGPLFHANQQVGFAVDLDGPGPHGLSEILYAFASAAGNNGSAFAGLNANTPFYNTAGGLAMLIGRYWLSIPALAIAGSLAAKSKVPAGAGTLPTHTPLFVVWLIAVVLVVGALCFLPALALGPIVEHLGRIL